MSCYNPIPWNSQAKPVQPAGMPMTPGAANAASVGSPVNTKIAPEIIASGAVAGGGFGSSVINFFSQRETNRNNARINRENNEANYRLWMANNEYNTPLQQRRRLEAAGFNPNLMYGSVSPGNSAAPAQSQASYEQAPQVGDLGAVFSNAYQTYRDQKLLEKQLENQELVNQGQEILNKQESKKLGYLDEQREEEKRAAKDLSDNVQSVIALNGQKIIESAAVVDKLASEMRLTSEQVIEAQLNNEYLRKTLDDRIEAIALQNGIARSQIDLYKQQIITLAKQALVFAAQAEAQENINSLWDPNYEKQSYLRGLTLNWKEWYDSYFVPHEVFKNSKGSKEIYHTSVFMGQALEGIMPLLIQSMSDEAAMRRALILNRNNGGSFEFERPPRGVGVKPNGTPGYYLPNGSMPRLLR